MKKVLLTVCFVVLCSVVFAQTKIDPSFQIKHSVLAPGEAIVGASSTQTLTNKTINADYNIISNLLVSMFKTVLANANKIFAFDENGAPTAASSIHESVSISGSSINRDYVSDTYIDSKIARDTEVTAAINEHNTASISHGLPQLSANDALKVLRVKSSADGYETASISTATRRRAEVVLSTATSTVVFGDDIEGNPVNIGNFAKCLVFVNGVLSKYSDFVKVSSNEIESTFGDMPEGTRIILDQVE